MLFYVRIDDRGRFNFSPAPGVDKLLAGRTKYLSPGLPLGLLQHYLKDLTGLIGFSPQEVGNEILKRIQKGLRKDKLELEELVWQESTVSHPGRAKCSELYNRRLFVRFMDLVEGKQFAEGEMTFLAKELKIGQDKVLCLMHKAVLENRGSWVPAIHHYKASWKCARCGSENSQEWPSLYGKTATCLGCASIGALNSLQVLFRPKIAMLNKYSELQASINQTSYEENSKSLDQSSKSPDSYYKFTPAQSRAAKELAVFFETTQIKEILVWAACGAGKTEICFPLISRHLEEGKKVLFAAPRQDVVHDVHQRLYKNFPQYRIKLLSGAVPPDPENSLLTVATTHQVLRFYRAFDLVIFDELDAYPYVGNDVLKYGMGQALKEDGRTVYLSATPSEEILEKINRKTCLLIRLPARYHGQPVPVPEILKMKLPEKNTTEAPRLLKHSCLAELRVICEELMLQGVLLVFVPTVAMVREWVKVFRDMFGDKQVEGSWGADPKRRDKILSFRTGKIKIFVSTSILERGVTINGVQVIVLYAHHELYDVRTLVQMAGRTGRTAQCPTGRALFLAPKKAEPMRAALDWIKEQNALAREGGFLDV